MKTFRLALKTPVVWACALFVVWVVASAIAPYQERQADALLDAQRDTLLAAWTLKDHQCTWPGKPSPTPWATGHEHILNNAIGLAKAEGNALVLYAADFKGTSFERGLNPNAPCWAVWKKA